MIIRTLCTFLVILAAGLAGCTRIGAVKPVGEPVPFKDSSELAGDWLGPKGKVYTVKVDLPSEEFHVSFEGEHGREEKIVKLTHLGEAVNLLWIKDTEIDAWLFFRVAGGDDSIALLAPDGEHIAKLVKSGLLSGTKDDKQNAWRLSGENLAGLVAGKELWDIDYAMAFVRMKPEKPAGPKTLATPAEK